MDEILASIRRIIESGEERPKPALAATAIRQAPRGGSALSMAEGRRDATPPPAEADRPAASVVSFSGFGMSPGVPTAGLPRDADLLQDDGDAQAAFAALPDERSRPRPRAEWPSGGAAASRDAGERALPDTPSPVRAEAPVPARPDVRDGPDGFSIEFDEADFAEELRRDAGLPEAAAEQAPRVPAPSNDVEVQQLERIEAFVFEPPQAPAAPVSVQGEPENAPAPQATPSVMAETSAIMSDQAGAEVAAAFDDLAQAIRDGQMKSMEGMAREMLRPMLQDWLDDNLPRLVERLVREEIERVSRGGRR